MTENRRIFLNIITTYGRSLYQIILGLLCGRWALQALGDTDYGLYGLVGGLTVFISFFNNVLAGANARFYAFSVGEAKVERDKSKSLEECRRWFNTALSIHTIVPVILIVLGYLLGIYAVRHWLTIPMERIEASVWVFRLVCVSCLVAMVNVPFSAMYRAKQYIAELTIYDFLTATANVVFLGYMVSHPGDWLTRYAAWGCAISVIPQLCICVRACHVFPECDIRVAYMWDRMRLKTLVSFAGWQMLGGFCGMLRSQGVTILINKLFGAKMNAANAIGSSVQGHCSVLAGAMQSAFVPVITQACGAGEYRKMNEFVMRTCKFNVLLTLIFMIPLALELPEVMRLWLGTPPAYTTGLCYCAMILHVIESSTAGHSVVINATGRIAMFHAVVCSVNVFTLPVAICLGVMYRNVYVVSGGVIGMQILHGLGRLYFARRAAGTSVRAWGREVLLPLFISLIACSAMGILPRFVFEATFSRICLTTLVCELTFFPLMWFVFLTSAEQQFLIDKFGARIKIHLFS